MTLIIIDNTVIDLDEIKPLYMPETVSADYSIPAGRIIDLREEE